MALFIDEAHDLHGNTLLGLKSLTELAQDGNEILSMLLVGQAKLKNDLRRSTKEEIGARASVFVLDGIKNNERPYMKWFPENVEQIKNKVKREVNKQGKTLFGDNCMTLLLMSLMEYFSILKTKGISYEVRKI